MDDMVMVKSGSRQSLTGTHDGAQRFRLHAAAACRLW
jgi:hypothetical protein